MNKQFFIRCHFILLIIFFLANGYYDYAGLIPVTDMMMFFIIVCIIAVLFFLLFSYFFKNQHKGALITTEILCFYLFYGAIQDYLKVLPGIQVISAHRYLLPIILICVTATFIFLNKSQNLFRRTSIYLTTLLSILILFDGIKITHRMFNTKKQLSTNNTSYKNPICDSCAKPDIYFILLDEYCGSRILKQYFQYDNSPFLNYLKSQGFYVPVEPSSNYSITPLSMAATFDMNYLTWDRNQQEVQSYAKAARIIPGSNSIQLLKSLGYRLQNYSIFDLGDQPSSFETGFLPMKLRLITSKTLAGRVKRDFFWRIQVRNKGTDNMLKWIASDTREGNERIIQLTTTHSKRIAKQPAFVYSHLIMPHAPFAFDSTGKERFVNFADPSLREDQKKDGYLQYLVYTNHRVQSLANDILTNTNRKAVIVLLSDHGYRESPLFNTCQDLNNNISAIFLPNGDYSYYYDSISNVNQFRVLFNSLFNTKMNVLKDSCVY